jgi:hypothetical protein
MLPHGMDVDYTTFHSWIGHVFDHPVTDPERHWDREWQPFDDSPAHVVACIARTFEQSRQVLRAFTDAQVAQGLNYLINPSCSDDVFTLLDAAVPWEARRRALAAIYSLFAQCFATRCSPALSAGSWEVGNPLNGVCFMWWEDFPAIGMRHRQPHHPDAAATEQLVLAVLRRILWLESDACRESALHGLNHWALHDRKEVEVIIERFLAEHRGLRPELQEYARGAREGRLL